MTDNKPNDCRPIKWDDNNTACKGTEAKTTLIGLPMTNNAPPDGGLFLHITEANSVKWSEGCHRCEQRGFTPYHSTCPDCHGTGKREAWVEGEVDMRKSAGGIPLHPMILSGQMDAILIRKYTEQFRDGTLPPELLQSATNPNGLRKVTR